MPAGQYLIGLAAYCRLRRARAKAAGLCISCQKNPTAKFAKCQDCRISDAECKRLKRAVSA